MKKTLKNEFSIENISTINVHHQNNTQSSILSILQLESGVVVIGLENGSILFFAQNDLKNPYTSLVIDIFPIDTIIQVQDDQLLCNSGAFIYLIFENKLKKYDYNKKEKIVIKNIYGKINKMILLPDDSLVIGDNKYISLFRKRGKKFIYIKQIKINSPILNLTIIHSSEILAVAPKKKSLIFVDMDKFELNYEIKNIKFFEDISYGNLICKITKDFLVIGGCMGVAYLISLKNKQFMANVNLKYGNELITAMHRMTNGDLLCGNSLIVKDENSKKELICSNLVQYRFENNNFKEIYRLKNSHDDVITKICEIVNHRGIGEIGTISLDSTFKVWN